LTALLSDIKSQILAQCDMVVDGFGDDADLIPKINDSYSELYDLLVTKFEDYFTTNFTFSIASGDDGYNMPMGIYKVMGVDKQITGPTDYITLPKFNFMERNKWNSTIGLIALNGFPLVSYDWVGGRLKIIPAANASGNYQMWYVPSCPELVNDSDSILYDLQRWSTYIVVDVAIKLMVQEESNADYLIMQKDKLIARINASAINRDAGQGERVTDIANMGGFFGGRYRNWE
jgi:hypothetical protein